MKDLYVASGPGNVARIGYFECGASLDEKLAVLSEQAAAEKTKKEEYDKKYQQSLSEVQEKQKEPKIIQRPANAPKSRWRWNPSMKYCTICIRSLLDISSDNYYH